MISHIRKATHGDRALRNTQPFIRELAGRTHVFAHNGELKGIEQANDLSLGRYQPVGDTDSELAFCNLLERLTPLWGEAADVAPSLEARLNLIADFAADLRPFGPANFLYADSDVLFVHADRPSQPGGEIQPPGCTYCNEVVVWQRRKWSMRVWPWFSSNRISHWSPVCP